MKAKHKATPTDLTPESLLRWAADELGVTPESLRPTSMSIATEISFLYDGEDGETGRMVRLKQEHIAWGWEPKPSATAVVSLADHFSTKVRRTIYSGPDGLSAIPTAGARITDSISLHREHVLEEERRRRGA